MIKKVLLMSLFFQILSNGYCQGLFNYDYTSYNPAFVGMYSKNNITFSTSEFQNKDYTHGSGRVIFSLPLKKIYSAVGVHANYEKYGFSSDLNSGLIYSFKYNFENNFSVALGANFSLFRSRIKGEFERYGDIFEFETAMVNETINLFNLDIGIWLNYKNFHAGFANQHINQPSKKYHFIDTMKVFKLNKITNVILKYDLEIGTNLALSNNLLIYDLKRFYDNKSMIINNLFNIKNTYLIGLTSKIFKSKNIGVFLSPNIGFNLNDKFKFITAVELIKINSGNSVGKIIDGFLIFNF